MENPAHEIKDVVSALTQGAPDEQRDAIYRYFAPGAAFEHPFCRVPSFTKLQLPGVGDFDSRALITAIFKWYKVLSPRIHLEIESCAFDEQANIIYLTMFQIFNIWFIPFYSARVRLVSVLHLTTTSVSEKVTPPPPQDAAQEKLHAVQDGTEPSYAAVTSGKKSARSASFSSQSSSGRTMSVESKRYLIEKQEDLYQVNEFLKFVTLTPGSVVANALQLFATLFCLVGSILLGPFTRMVWPANSGNVSNGGNMKQRRS